MGGDQDGCEQRIEVFVKIQKKKKKKKFFLGGRVGWKGCSIWQGGGGCSEK